MDHDRARSLLLAERGEVADLLADAESSGEEDRAEEDEDAHVYDSDAAQPLTAEGVEVSLADVVRTRILVC